MESRSVDVAGASVRVRIGGPRAACRSCSGTRSGMPATARSSTSPCRPSWPPDARPTRSTGRVSAARTLSSPAATRSTTSPALLWDVVGALGLTRPVVLSGHSWGGAVAIAAAQRPADVGALVLLDSGHLDYADVPGANAGGDGRRADRRARSGSVRRPRGTSSLRCSPSTASTRSGRLPRGGRDSRSSRTGESPHRIECRAPAASQGLMRGAPAAPGRRWRPRASRPSCCSRPSRRSSASECRGRAADAGGRLTRGHPADKGMRHAVFADLGASAGTLVADWLREQRLAGISRA